MDSRAINREKLENSFSVIEKVFRKCNMQINEG